MQTRGSWPCDFGPLEDPGAGLAVHEMMLVWNFQFQFQIHV